MGIWARLALPVAGALTVAAAVACGNPGAPGGQGNTFIDDTRDAEPRPPANPTPPPDDGSVPTQPDAPYYPDGAPSEASTVTYPGLTACDTCTCAPSNGYCFGGATSRMGFGDPEAKADGGGDGGLPACPLLDAGAPGIGCNPLPATCTDCACIIALLQPSYACYLVCANDGKKMTVYCPNP